LRTFFFCFRFSCYLSIFLAYSALRAQVSLPHFFSDHAVLQRERPIHIWGWAKSNETITLSFHQQTTTAIADNLGCWSAWLMPESAGGPYELTVTGSSKVTLRDLLVGDVWLASGQSNMQMPLKGFNAKMQVTHGIETARHASLPQVRLLNVGRRSDSLPQVDIDSQWTTVSPQSAIDFSAVAFFFGRDINQLEHIPIGLIEVAWGGTPLEAWMSMDGLAQDASLMPVFAASANFTNAQANVDRQIAIENLEDAAAIKAHQPVTSHPWRPIAASWMPGGIYNGMIAPLAGYAMKGVIWYQGESNSTPDRAFLYAKLMPAFIADWRAKWKQGNFPFLYVQLSSLKTNNEWGLIRDAQRMSLAVANTGMAVTLDIGAVDNIHPPNKEDVAARLSLVARALAYDHPIEYSGPLFRQATPEANSIRVWFDHADGLLAKGSEVEGFEIATANGEFVPAKATIEHNTVVVRSDSLSRPRYVRYGWASFTKANLYNRVGLPASTFSSK
jgi:sialate O-acetylesterase